MPRRSRPTASLSNASASVFCERAQSRFRSIIASGESRPGDAKDSL
jgi:hypothetical protein